MRYHRLSLFALSILVISAFTIVATRYSNGQSQPPPKTLKMKVMRGKQHLKNSPTQQEIAFFQEAQVGEREFEDSIPKHLPIKIKIRKEQEKGFKDLSNEGWARDFELEVTNTGTKPIFFLSIYLNTDVVAAGGYRIVFPLTFGRLELSDFRKKAEPDDIAIKPGDTYSLKIHPGQLEGWEARNRAEHRRHPKKIRAVFQLMTFGDGTGFAATDGSPLPRSIDGKVSLNHCPRLTGKNGPEILEGPSDYSWPTKLAHSGKVITGFFFR